MYTSECDIFAGTLAKGPTKHRLVPQFSGKTEKQLGRTGKKMSMLHQISVYREYMNSHEVKLHFFKALLSSPFLMLK